MLRTQPDVITQVHNFRRYNQNGAVTNQLTTLDVANAQGSPYAQGVVFSGFAVWALGIVFFLLLSISYCIACCRVKKNAEAPKKPVGFLGRIFNSRVLYLVLVLA